MAKRKASAALAWMLTAAMAINSGSIAWAAEDGKISVERIETNEAVFSDGSEKTTDLTDDVEGKDNADVQKNSEDAVTFSDEDEGAVIESITVNNPGSIPDVFYQQFLNIAFSEDGHLALKKAVENTSFNIQLSNGESKTVTGLGEVEGLGTLSLNDPYENYRNYPTGKHKLSLSIGGENYDTDYEYSVQDVKDMSEDHKVDIQAEDTYVPMKHAVDGLNIKRFYFENTSDSKKTYQIKFDSNYTIDKALVSIDGKTATSMASVTGADPLIIELNAGSKAYVEYNGAADTVNVREKNITIKSVHLMTPQLFKDFPIYGLENVMAVVETETDGKIKYYTGNDVSQLGGITYKIEGTAENVKINTLDEGAYSLTCSFGSLPGQEFTVEDKLELVSYHKYYQDNENPIGEENSSITLEFDKGKPYNDSMCVGATIQTAGTYIVQIDYKDDSEVWQREFEAYQWGGEDNNTFINQLGGVMNLTSNSRDFKPGPILVWAKNADSVTIAKVSKEELQKLCDKCEGLNESDYTKESWSQLETQWNNAKALLEQEDSSDSQIGKAIVSLNKAILGLEKNGETPVVPEPTVTPTPTPSEPITTPTPTPVPSEPTTTPTPTPVPSEPTVTPTPSQPDTPSQPTPAPVPDGYPDGTTSDTNGNFTTPNGTVIKSDGSITLPDGSVIKADEQGNKPSIDKEGNVTDTTNGTVVDVNGNITLPGAELNDTADNITVSIGKNGSRPQYIQSEGAVITAEGSVISRPGLEDVEAGAGWKVTSLGVATDTEGNVYDIDGSVRTSEGTYTKPAKAVTKETNKAGNKAKIKMEKCNGAQGYDFVIGKSADLLKTKDYSKVVKNQKSPEATFNYTDKGTWYVACHAWTRGADGKKVFGQWSEVQKIKITATTPKQPKIKSVVKKGSSITVTYTASKNADGYEIVLGTKYSKVNGEKRPTNYGKYIKKIKGNKFSVTFKNVKPGTYYVGLHSWNCTSEDKSKVFSEWSGVKKITKK